MKRIRQFREFFQAALWLLGLPSLVVAQQQDAAAEGSTGKSWLFGYFIVGLFIALGLVILCRPGSRKLEFRRPDEV